MSVSLNLSFQVKLMKKCSNNTHKGKVLRNRNIEPFTYKITING